MAYLVSCRPDAIPKPVLNLVDQRIQLYRSEQDSICKSLAIKKAEIAVDSFFLTLRQQFLLDSIHVPTKPIKPNVDTSIHLDNSTPVKPLWDSMKLKIK